MIGPKSGYWRKDNLTDTFIACPNSDACLGLQSALSSPTGDCAENYEGILCTECVSGYSTTGTFECS